MSQPTQLDILRQTIRYHEGRLGSMMSERSRVSVVLAKLDTEADLEQTKLEALYAQEDELANATFFAIGNGLPEPTYVWRMPT